MLYSVSYICRNCMEGGCMLYSISSRYHYCMKEVYVI